MEKTYLKKFVSYAAATALAVSALSVASPANATTTLDATGATFDFSNVDAVSLNLGESYLYENVATIDGTTIDATMVYDDKSDYTEVWDFDTADSTEIDTFIWVNCDGCDEEADYTPADNYKGYLQYTINFYLHGTQTPVTLQNLSINIRDVDTYQYLEVLNPKSYVLDANTALSVVYPEDNADIPAGHVRFMENNGAESEPEDEPFWASATFADASTFTFKIGQDIPGGAHFYTTFAVAPFSNPVEHVVGEVEVPKKLSKTVYFTGDSAYLQPKFFKGLDKFIASIPTCARITTAKIYSGVKKAKSEVKGNDLAQRRAAILKKFLNKRGISATITLLPNGKGTKALNKKRFAKVVIKYTGCN